MKTFNSVSQEMPDAGNPPVAPTLRSVLFSALATAGVFCGNAADVDETKAYVEGSTLKLDVKSGETLNYNTLLSTLGITAIEKNGLGKAYFNYGLAVTNVYTGTITIKAGTLGASSLDNYGTPSTITVEDGGALDLSQVSGAPSDPRVMYNGNTKLIFAGSGPDGWAVYRKDGSGGADHLFKNAEMTGDATVGGSKRWGIGGGGLEFNMNSQTLTVDNSGGDFLLDAFTAVNPGNIVKKGSGQLVFQGAAIDMGGGAANEVLLTSGSVCLWGNKDKSILWRMAVASNSTFAVYQGGGKSYDFWNGDILHTNGTFDLKAGNENSVLTLKGNVTTADCDAMSGGKAGPYVRINNSSKGLVRFLGGTWTNAMTHGAKSECLDIYGGAFEFAGTGPHLMGRVGVHNTNTWFHNCGHITKCGAWYIETLRNSAGSNLARLNLDHLTIDQTDTATINMANSNTNNWGTLCIGEDAVVTAKVNLALNGSAALQVVKGGKLRWLGGSVNSNSRSQGYVLLDDGEVERAADLAFGSKGHAVYLQRGGTYKQTTGTFKAHTHGDTEVIITGGTFRPYSANKGHWNGQCENTTKADPGINRQNVTVRGTGVLDSYYYCFAATNACQCSMMLGAGGTWKAARMYLDDRDKKPDVRWDLGFDGGVLKPLLGWVFFTIANNTKSPHAITVYKGGAIIDTSESEHEYNSDKSNDYGVDCHFGAPLLAPTGMCVASVALPTDAAFATGNHYNVPPRVIISGTGHAATAIADLDDETGAVKGIVVTCPGYGYDDSTTATIESWNGYVQYPCAVTLETAKGGGLTKRGENGLVLYSGQSTFAGDVTIEGGFVKMCADNAIPQGRSLNLASGQLDLNAHPLSVNRLTGYGTVKTSGTATLTVTGGVDVAAADMLADRQIALQNNAKIAFAAGTKVNVSGLAEALAALTPEQRKTAESKRYTPIVWPTPLDADAVVPEIVGVPDTWSATLSSDRRSIRVGALRGLVLVFR